MESTWILSALNLGRAKVDRKWTESGLGQSMYGRWIEVDQSRLDVIIDGQGFCHVTRLPLLPVTRFKIATSGPRSIRETKEFLHVGCR